MTEETKQKIRTLRASGMAQQQIASIVGYSRTQVRRVLAEPTDTAHHDAKDLRRYVASLENKVRMWDVIGDRLVDAIDGLPELTPPKVRNSDFSNEDRVLVLSDIHAGAKVDAKGTGGLGSFNSEVLAQRMDTYFESVVSIMRRYKEMPAHIRVFALGDLIEGSTIFHGQQRAIDMTTVQQILAIIDYLAKLLNELSTYAPITMYCVVGNHGRIGKKGENDPMDNLDYLAYKWLAERLSNNRSVTLHVAESWFQLVEVRRHRFLLVHGDGIYGSYLGIPMYGSLKHEGNWQRLLKDFGGFDYLVVGHHHTPAHLQNIIMNGAWPGGSEFSLRQMTRGGRPSQKTFNVHDRIGLTDMRDILLDVDYELDNVRVYS